MVFTQNANMDTIQSFSVNHTVSKLTITLKHILHMPQISAASQHTSLNFTKVTISKEQPSLKS
jgi:hypothetical protein